MHKFPSLKGCNSYLYNPLMNRRKDIVKSNLKEYRLKAGLTQKRDAKVLGMQYEDRLSHWEKGQAMPSAEFNKISQNL